MINTDIILTGAISIIASIVSAWGGYYFARRKYHIEVDSTEINNLKESLTFYQKIVEDNNNKLTYYIKVSENNTIETQRLKSVVLRLLNNSCLKNSCIERQYYTEDEIREILEGAIHNKSKNEIKTT